MAVHPIPAFYFSSLPCSSRTPPGAPSPVHPPGVAWHFAGGASGADWPLSPLRPADKRGQAETEGQTPPSKPKAEGHDLASKDQGPRTQGPKSQGTGDRTKIEEEDTSHGHGRPGKARKLSYTSTVGAVLSPLFDSQHICIHPLAVFIFRMVACGKRSWCMRSLGMIVFESMAVRGTHLRRVAAILKIRESYTIRC